MMFKMKSGRGVPCTPKISSISLPPPEREEIAGSRWDRNIAKRNSEVSRLPSNSGQYYQSSQPQSRTRTESLRNDGAQDNRKVPLKSILKQPKPMHHGGYHSDYTPQKVAPPSKYHTMASSDGRGGWMPQQEGYRLSSVQHPLKNQAEEFPSKPDKTSNSKVYQTSSKKYVLISEVPLKAEAVSLSWPLVSYHQRKRERYPLLYFDIGIDPRISSNLTLNRGGFNSKATRAEGEIPVSSHCNVTSMVITCETLKWWPVHVHRSEGLRCIDVFVAIYETFHKRLSDQERRALDPHNRCRAAFKQRCKDSPGITEVNENKGLLRVDLLRGYRIFKGIAQSGSDWILTIDNPRDY